MHVILRPRSIIGKDKELKIAEDWLYNIAKMVTEMQLRIHNQ
jgi:hypothetical protein